MNEYVLIVGGVFFLGLAVIVWWLQSRAKRTQITRSNFSQMARVSGSEAEGDGAQTTDLEDE